MKTEIRSADLLNVSDIFPVGLGNYRNRFTCYETHLFLSSKWKGSLGKTLLFAILTSQNSFIIPSLLVEKYQIISWFLRCMFLKRLISSKTAGTPVNILCVLHLYTS